jgi:hypothetical protein
MRDATDESIEQAFTTGAILRTHVMRPTWHFVTPGDIRWMLELTASRVNTASAYMYRQFEVDDTLFSRSNVIIAKALKHSQYLTRPEIGLALARAGIVAQGVRLGLILLRAELDAIIFSGPRRGPRFTYALLDERAPQTRVLHREEALAELTRRYFTGHGPATAHDFAWWSGLKMTDAKAGLEMVASHLTHETIDGQTYWFSASVLPGGGPSPEAFLLPTYDEFLVGFASFNQSRLGGRDAGENVAIDSTILIGGRVAGQWKRTLKKREVVIELAPFAPLTAAEALAINAAARRSGDFIGRPSLLHYVG